MVIWSDYVRMPDRHRGVGTHAGVASPLSGIAAVGDEARRKTPSGGVVMRT